MSEPTAKDSIKVVATNRKAWHIYEITDRFEAGLVLHGTEVKSLRAGRASLVDSYATFTQGEAFLSNLMINPYAQGNLNNHPERRPRKLLLHRREIDRLMGQVAQKGFTIVPLQIYFKGSRVKVELGLARGKKDYEKRDDIKTRDARREIDRAMKDQKRRS